MSDQKLFDAIKSLLQNEKFDEDYPSLFEKKPTLFNQKLKGKN